MAERARLSAESLRVAVLADRGHLAPRGALDDERAGPDLVARRTDDRLALAGQDRLVEPQAIRFRDHRVSDQLVVRLEPQRVTDDDVLDRDAACAAVADHGRRRGDERGQAIQRPLRPHLLHDADRGVRDDDAEEQGIAGIPEQQREDAEHRQDGVEDRDDIGDDDARVRAAGHRPRNRPPLGQAPRRLELGEAIRDRSRARRSERARHGLMLDHGAGCVVGSISGNA
jgi:hypothetical protein